MLKKFLILAGTLLIAACTQPPPPAPPPAPAPTSFVVFFDLDSAVVSAQAQETLKQAATAYKSSGSPSVISTGHTDTTGPAGYNMGLSLRRSNAVKAVLVREGVPAAAVTVVARGESQPLVKTGDGVLEPQNRRDEVVIGGTPPNPGDLAYCKAMSAKYRQFVDQSSQSDAGEAMNQCENGNPAASIPVLEKLLIASKVPLPPRT